MDTRKINAIYDLARTLIAEATLIFALSKERVTDRMISSGDELISSIGSGMKLVLIIALVCLTLLLIKSILWAVLLFTGKADTYLDSKILHITTLLSNNTSRLIQIIMGIMTGVFGGFALKAGLGSGPEIGLCIAGGIFVAAGLVCMISGLISLIRSSKELKVEIIR